MRPEGGSKSRGTRTARAAGGILVACLDVPAGFSKTGDTLLDLTPIVWIMWMAHATAFFNRETTHFNGCSFFILNSDYKTLQQYMDSISRAPGQGFFKPYEGTASLSAAVEKNRCSPWF